MLRKRTVSWRLVLVLPAMVALLPRRGLAEEQAAPQAPDEAAAGKDWSLDLDLTYNSKYVWRGIQLTPDPVFQPSVNFAYKGWTLNVWANMDTTNVNDFDNQFLEVDYTLDYSFSWQSLDFSIGAIHYAFPQAHVIDTTEAYLSVGLDVPTSPTLTVYQDVDEHDGTYILLSLGHTFEDVWTPRADVSMSVDLSTTFGWCSSKHNRFNIGLNHSGWMDAIVSVGLPFAVGDHLTITPSANYMWILDDGFTSALGDDDAFWAGISFTFSF